MVAYRFVTEELVTEPHPTMEFETDWQMPPLWATMEFTQGADSTYDGFTNGVFLGADTGTVEIEIFIGYPVNLDSNVLNTGPHTLAYYYDLVPGDNGPKGFFRIYQDGFHEIVANQLNSDGLWRLGYGVDVPMGGCTSGVSDEGPNPFQPGPLCYALGHWERIAEGSGDGGAEIPEPGLAAVLALSVIALTARRRKSSPRFAGQAGGG